jgi:hypothetical protein
MLILLFSLLKKKESEHFFYVCEGKRQSECQYNSLNKEAKKDDNLFVDK